MGEPICLQMNNSPTYTSHAFAQFYTHLNIIFTHGIPHDPTRQALGEQAHYTLKTGLLIQTQKGDLASLILIMP